MDTQDTDPATSLVIKTELDPTVVAPAIREAVGSVSPGATVTQVTSLESLVAATTALPRFRSLMLTSLAGIAVILAVLGVYGVIALSVADRRREIGLRMTLGADRGDILRQILTAGAWLIVPGLLFGVAAAVLAVRLIESYVFEVPTTDPYAFAGVAVLVGAVSALATWIPARRAARIEPLIVLRGD